MLTLYDTVVVRTACKLLIPFTQVFGLYVIFHGHESPGGGFQGGAILGASFILTRLTQTSSIAGRVLPADAPLRLGALGMLIYAAVGFLPVIGQGNFLDYGRLGLPGISPPEMRALGILGIEIGVAVAVTGVMLAIFDQLAPAADEGG